MAFRADEHREVSDPRPSPRISGASGLVQEGNNLHYEHLGNTLESQLKTCVTQANANYNN